MCHQTDHQHALISDCSSPLTALRCWAQPLHPRPHGHAVTSHHGRPPAVSVPSLTTSCSPLLRSHVSSPLDFPRTARSPKPPIQTRRGPRALSSFGLIRSGSSTAFSSPCLDPRSLAPLPSPLHSRPLFTPSLQSRARAHPSEPLPASCTCRPSRPFHLSCLSTPRSYRSPTLPLPTPTRKVRPGVHEQKRLPRGSPVW